METAETVVIGAGIVGLSTAYELARKGVPHVVVLERSSIGAGATGKSGAIIRQHYSNPTETRLAQASLKVFEHWADEVGGDCGFTRTGLLILVPPEMRDDLDANVAMQHELGVDVDVVTPADVHDLDPCLSLDDGALAAYEPGAGVADPAQTVYTLARAATRSGVSIRTNSHARSIRVKGERIVGVETADGDLATERVVIAAGAWAHELLRPLGIDLPMTPSTSRVAIFRWPIDRDPRHPVCIDHGPGMWLRPIYGTSTLIGAELGVRRAVDPDLPIDTIDQPYVEHCRTQLSRRYPVMAGAISAGGWTGILMRSDDGRPIIDRLEPYDGLYCMAGDSGTSFKTAPAIGRCLAEWLVDGRTALADLTPFRASRFAEGKPWIDNHEYVAKASISR